MTAVAVAAAKLDASVGGTALVTVPAVVGSGVMTDDVPCELFAGPAS